MDKHKEIIRPIEVDGIQEYDNQLPRWWVGLFIITTIIGVAYGINLHFLGGKSLIDIHDEAMTEIMEKEQAVAEASGTGADTEGGLDLNSFIGDSNAVTSGKKAYETNCAPCHRADGGGGIGPNLVDNYWIHGSSAEKIYDVIANGRVEKGMMAWRAILGDKSVKELTAFVVSIKGSDVADPKAPQGEPAGN